MLQAADRELLQSILRRLFVLLSHQWSANREPKQEDLAKWEPEGVLPPSGVYTWSSPPHLFKNEKAVHFWTALSQTANLAYSVDSISNPHASSNGSGMYLEFLFRRAHSRSRVERKY